MAATKRQCSTCEHYGAPRGKKLYHGHVYRCLWKMPEVVWPSSMTDVRRPLIDPYRMEPNAGKTCPAWQPQAAALDEALADRLTTAPADGL